jgi:hypothetical protein
VSDKRQGVSSQVSDALQILIHNLDVMMGKRKRKLAPSEKDEKNKRRKDFMTIFVNGKQKRVRRSPTTEGMDVDEFLHRNADAIWLHQHEMWEYMKEPDF